MKSCYVIGLMSGTSLDGVDAALVKISEAEDDIFVEPVHFITLPFSNDIKHRILDLCVPESARVEDISAKNMFLGELFAEAALKLTEESELKSEDILLISSHGQTIYHQPHPVMIDNRDVTSTLQIGDIAVIAERTGITTVGDFRTRDMAAGGQGAPLVPYVDYLLFKEKEFGRVLVNIGGISNITILPKNGSESDIFAYDTGPGNMIMDSITTWATNGEKSYDKDGAMASRGKVNKKWLNQLLKHAYFSLPAPKSTGREMFGVDFASGLWSELENTDLSNEDKIATVTELTAKSIALEINKYRDSGSLKEVLVGGGGRYNLWLMERLQYYLHEDINVLGMEAYGIKADEKEAVAFALLGYQCYKKRTNNLPAATGANNGVVMGKIAW